ncbi:hypothetical protein DFJ73DRAFT_823677 [Zopfochytrium polystomum]|nr:hypothetical protein DFJ73DRAFT_823677 [Zopfochytrium polystomum]
MGVAGLWQHLSQRFPGCFRAIGKARPRPRPPTCKRLFVLIDVNALIHAAARSSSDGEQEVLGRLKSIVAQWIKTGCQEGFDGEARFTKAPITTKVFLAVDGPPPWQKMHLQRKRRGEKFVKLERNLSSHFDTINITPGCKFMEEVDSELVELAKLLVAGQRAWKKPADRAILEDVIVSGAGVPGEGETKMSAMIHWNHAFRRQKGDKFVIVSSDADAIVSALLSPADITVVSPSHRAVFRKEDMMGHRGDGASRLSPLRLNLALFALLTSGNDYFPPIRRLRWSDIQTACEDSRISPFQFEGTGAQAVPALDLRALSQLLMGSSLPPSTEQPSSASATPPASKHSFTEWPLSEVQNVTCENYFNALLTTLRQCVSKQFPTNFRNAHNMGFGPSSVIFGRWLATRSGPSIITVNGNEREAWMPPFSPALSAAMVIPHGWAKEYGEGKMPDGMDEMVDEIKKLLGTDDAADRILSANRVNLRGESPPDGKHGCRALLFISDKG